MTAITKDPERQIRTKKKGVNPPDQPRPVKSAWIAREQNTGFLRSFSAKRVTMKIEQCISNYNSVAWIVYSVMGNSAVSCRALNPPVILTIFSKPRDLSIDAAIIDR